MTAKWCMTEKGIETQKGDLKTSKYGAIAHRMSKHYLFNTEVQTRGVILFKSKLSGKRSHTMGSKKEFEIAWQQFKLPAGSLLAIEPAN